MVSDIAKRIASRLPSRWQQMLKRQYYARQIRRGRFATVEIEPHQTRQWLREGDWVLDVGANVGNYTALFSEAVGESGRVIAIEPVPETFELLAANMALLPNRNVTLLNIAASETASIQGMAMPFFDTGLKNYYRASLTKSLMDVQVLCMPIDALDLPHPIALVKIDAEGHDHAVLKGMVNLLTRDYPRLIVEGDSPELLSFLRQRDYVLEKERVFGNLVFTNPQRARNLAMRA